MGKIIKNLRPYWYMVLGIVILLILQAYGDLSLPQYTSNIIDIGIQNKGISHILPEKITVKDYDYGMMFMTEEEKKLWSTSYEREGELYVNISDEEKLNQLDSQLLTPIVLTYRMANMSEAQFKTAMKGIFAKNPATSQMADSIEEMSIEEIGQFMQIELSTFESEDEFNEVGLYVDMRPIFQQMIDSGQMSMDDLSELRVSLEDSIKTIGEKTISSMGIAFAIKADTNAGIDMDKLQMSYLWSEGGKMLVMAFMILIAAVLVGYLAAKIGAHVGQDLRKAVFKKVVGFSNAEMDQFSTASLITRSTNDVQQIQMVTTMMLRIVVYAPILGIGGVYKVIQTGANMGWIVGLALLVILGIVMILMVVAMPKFKIMQNLVDGLNLVTREILTGLSVIRAFGREAKEEERFEKANVELTKNQLFTSRVMTFMMPLMMLVMYGLTLSIVWVGAHKIDSGTLEVGAMTAFITYSMQIVMSFLMLTIMSIMLPRAAVSADRIYEVLQTESSIEEIKSPLELTQTKGVVEFKEVTFRYPNATEDALSKINFIAEPGKTTAIIGSTGSGKTTLINLIPRFYDVASGSITVDQMDIKQLNLKKLRQIIGFVPQKGMLFSGTIESNIKFGKPDASLAEVESAAEIAQAIEFIEEKNERYESEIAQGGSNVSGGQKQRLAIARAIAKKPKIFIFDDSFSALDMKTDAKLRKALDEKVKDSTVIIVAQRISTILSADQIIVLDEGKIVGKGTHKELLIDCEVYQQIAKSQLSEKELGMNLGREDK